MKYLPASKLSASPAAGGGSQELEELHEASEVCLKPTLYFGFKEHIEELSKLQGTAYRSLVYIAICKMSKIKTLQDGPAKEYLHVIVVGRGPATRCSGLDRAQLHD